MIRHTQVGGKFMASSMIMSQSQSGELHKPAPLPSQELRLEPYK